MKIILLSGGSGKRLWPLSNSIRSKQFLKLLHNPEGEAESMVQRVVRQLRASGLDGEIVVATGTAQRDFIQNQLGDSVGTVCEPSRRDTFPAIALATGYLRHQCHCSDNETVVVMPCDPYTEDGYFKTIARMVKAVEASAADLVLMGIRPDSASTKFGYVVPAKNSTDSGVERVERFTEKPDTDKARSLLAEGAYWNGGVFAFRLGYMNAITDKYIKADNYEHLHSNYDKLPRISFDYEVAERASSVAVVPFAGEWKDLGTWDSLACELPDTPIGNATSIGCESTHIVNELSLPLLCVGTDNLIVAASPDGILVADKSASADIKKHVEQIADRPMYEERRWGTYKVIDYISFDDGHRALTKQLCITASRSISYQIHRHRDEVWSIINGKGELVLDGIRRTVTCGDVIHIKAGQMHAIKATTDLHIIEVQSGDLLTEDDIERFPFEW